MKTNSIIMTAAIALVTISALLVFTNRPIRAEDISDTAALSAKLDEVLNNQKAILDGITSIKEELRVIKIRVTQNQ